MTSEKMVLLDDGAAAKTGFNSSDDEEGDVDTSPLHIDWLDLSKYGCTEKLGICSLPDFLKSEGIKDTFTLCTHGELGKYRVRSLLKDLSEAEITSHHYPFPDGQTPNMGVLLKLLDEVRVNLMQGRRSAIHCYGGLGRSCLIAACLMMMMDSKLEADNAIETLRKLRGNGAIQSVKQYNFVMEFRDKMKEHEKNRESSARSVSR